MALLSDSRREWMELVELLKTSLLLFLDRETGGCDWKVCEVEVRRVWVERRLVKFGFEATRRGALGAGALAGAGAGAGFCGARIWSLETADLSRGFLISPPRLSLEGVARRGTAAGRDGAGTAAVVLAKGSLDWGRGRALGLEGCRLSSIVFSENAHSPVRCCARRRSCTCVPAQNNFFPFTRGQNKSRAGRCDGARGVPENLAVSDCTSMSATTWTLWSVWSKRRGGTRWKDAGQ